MKITQIAIWDHRPIFRDGPFIMSHVSQSNIVSRIIQITLDTGDQGVGEIIFPPSIPITEVEARINAEKDYLNSLIGQDLTDLETVINQFSERDKAWRAVAFGLDTAKIDLQARQRNCSFSEQLGGEITASVLDYISISEKTLPRLQKRLTITGPDRVIQLEIGIGSIEDDCQQLNLTLESAAKNQTILADANGGWTIERALETITRFDDARIIWEEPCSVYKDNAIVAERSGKPIMLDQCIIEYETALRAIVENRVHSICIKPPVLGSLNHSRNIRDLCIEKKIPMRIDGPFCSNIANAAILSLALGTPEKLLISGCDLCEPLVIDNNLPSIRQLSRGRIAPPEGLGLGITDMEESLGSPDNVYQ
ncbi:MAG: L-alanine-DL-glutamate epimerase-like enolase superfamily enzyme [Gammaproteobacteria bacterium]|jgi:L-alanine-DL-glutamate epimerase-like enolase superfamily enzyme